MIKYFRNTDKPQAHPRREGKAAEPQPIVPLVPIDNTQPEVPKVGTTDAPGG